jgi:uracil-DNA glycosylase family 4
MPHISDRVRALANGDPNSSKGGGSVYRVPDRLPLPMYFRQRRLTELVRHVQGCRACPRMEGRKRVLTSENGSAAARVMFIAEAPGRNGADRTGIPLHGDPSGNIFESLLESVGWQRRDVFITNAVLCNPRDEEGRNSTPTAVELANCSFNLDEQIRVVDPVVIATLGQSALSALSLIREHSYKLSRVVGTGVEWNGRILFPLYHTSPRAMIHRSITKQTMDFRWLKELVDAKVR